MVRCAVNTSGVIACECDVGYLKTNEVVLGGNCYSCSVCVPDGQFDRYSVEQRQTVVGRMSDIAQTAFEGLERYASQSPTKPELEKFVEIIKQEESAGRSVRIYALTWSGRLLQDTPGHQAALWIRVSTALVLACLRLSNAS